jgi:hypothetical protein
MMAKTSTIRASEIQLDGNVTLWDVMRATLREKEARPDSSILPTILILKAQHIVAQVYPSREEPRTLLVRTAIGIRKINLNWYDVLLMLYRTSILTLQKMEGSAVILFGERTEDAGNRVLYAKKWTARQFLQQPPRGAHFPETNDCICQPFCLDNEKVHWISEVNTALQFSF